MGSAFRKILQYKHKYFHMYRLIFTKETILEPMLLAGDLLLLQIIHFKVTLEKKFSLKISN